MNLTKNEENNTVSITDITRTELTAMSTAIVLCAKELNDAKKRGELEEDHEKFRESLVDMSKKILIFAEKFT